MNEIGIALQICAASNLQTALLTARRVETAGQPERQLIAIDTPTGPGIMPLGMLYTILHLAGFGGMDMARATAAATSNHARTYSLNSSVVAPGRDVDVVLLNARAGGPQADAFSALGNGDVPAVGAAFTNSAPRFVGRSRNTPVINQTVQPPAQS